jgi:hypothetical protein
MRLTASMKIQKYFWHNFLNAHTVLHLIRLTECIRHTYSAELSWEIWWSRNKAVAFRLVFETSRNEYGFFRPPSPSLASDEVWYVWGRPTPHRIPLQSVGATPFCQLVPQSQTTFSWVAYISNISNLDQLLVWWSQGKWCGEGVCISHVSCGR